MKKGDRFPDSELCDTIWGPTSHGGDVTFIAYYDKFRRPCKKEDSAFCITAEFRKDGTMVHRETSDEPWLSDDEWKEGQILHAKDFAIENGWEIKGYAFDEHNDLIIRYSSPNDLEPILVKIGKYLLQKSLITDLSEKNKALKLIKG